MTEFKRINTAAFILLDKTTRIRDIKITLTIHCISYNSACYFLTNIY